MIELVLLAVIAVADHVPNAMPAVVASRYAKNFSAVAVQKSFPVPVPQAGEVLVEVLASSINPIDWKVLDGALKDIFPLKFPQILGCDFVGRVVRAGALPQGALSQGALVWGDLGAGASETRAWQRLGPAHPLTAWLSGGGKQLLVRGIGMS